VRAGYGGGVDAYGRRHGGRAEARLPAAVGRRVPAHVPVPRPAAAGVLQRQRRARVAGGDVRRRVRAAPYVRELLWRTVASMCAPASSVGRWSACAASSCKLDNFACSSIRVVFNNNVVMCKHLRLMLPQWLISLMHFIPFSNYNSNLL
jgi:hypothetical protein